MEENVMIDYILKQEKISQEHLMAVYNILDELIGYKTTKVISYQMPTFKAKRNVVHFAAFKNHIGIYPGAQAIEEFKEEFEGYKSSKGTLQIKYNEKIPKELIEKMVLYSYNLNK